MRGIAAALLVVGALAVPAHADHERYLTVSGDGPGYVDVRFTSPVSLDGGLTKFRTSGSVAGLYVRPLTRGVTAYEVVVSVRDVGLLGGGVAELPAGTYRVYLVTDGHASVRILAKGLHDHVTVRASHRVPMTVSGGRVELREDGALRYRGERTTRIRGGRSYTMSAFRMTIPQSDVPVWGDVKDCIGSEAECAPGASDGYVPGRRTTTWGSHTYPQGTVSPGVLHQRYSGTANAEVFVFAMEIPL